MAIPRDVTPLSTGPLINEAALWQAIRNGDALARERLIEAYLPFARILAAKVFAGRTDQDIPFADYLQFATVGLIESVDRFDPSRDVQFKTFAGHRICGAVLNGMEYFSERRAQVAAFGEVISERRESAKADAGAGGDVLQMLAEVAVSLAFGYLLEHLSYDDGGEPGLPESQYAGLELRQLRDRVRALVNRLPQRERTVIKCHYLNHMPFTEIAEHFGITKGRVSQVHKKALDLLREMSKSVKAGDAAW